MISRAHRFHGYGSLRQVYSSGRTVRGPLFSIKCQVNEKRQTYRVAVVVSKKVCKSAVGRNRMRRRVYASVRQLESHIAQPYDIVITIFQDSLLQTPPKELNRQVKSQLTTSGILTSLNKPS